jgi:hypothetical protein
LLVSFPAREEPKIPVLFLMADTEAKEQINVTSTNGNTKFLFIISFSNNAIGINNRY